MSDERGVVAGADAQNGEGYERMKRIAMIMEAGKRAFASTRAAWFLKKIREMEEEINLYIFRSAGVWTLDLNYNVGEYNIYQLPDLSEFDGIILDVNSIHQREHYGCGAAAWDYIVNAARQSGKPVISLANKIEGFYYVGIDNYAAMRLMMEHVFHIHGCRKFWFIMGPKDNYENGQRMQAVIDYLKEQNVPCKEDMFYCESFEIRSGYRGFLKLYGVHRELPEAVICANDEIAVGVCKAAEACCYTETEGVFWDSCGCRTAGRADLTDYVRKEILKEAAQSDFEEEIKMLEYELLYCKTLHQIYEKILTGIPSLQYEDMYLMMDEKMDDFHEATGDCLEDIARLFGNGSFHVNGYPDRVQKVFIDPADGKIRIETKNRKGLFSAFESNEGGREYLFLPFHFSQYTVGYIVIINSACLMEKRYLDKMLSTIMTSMENFYRNKRLECINRGLEEISMRDAMTGLYNRLGYQNQACRIFWENKEKNRNLTILFIDMDRLKYMNDTYGHECGDLAIKITAGAILRYRPDDALAVRMGGDEFLVVLPYMERKNVVELVDRIRSEISRQAKLLELPCELSISAGGINTDMESGKALDDYVREADEIMYREKSARKKQREA